MDCAHIPDYQMFQKWFTQNGGLHKNTTFPTKFPPTNYTGLSSSATIPANNTILSIPKSLLLTPTAAKNSQLSPILQTPNFNTPHLNNPTQNEFDILVLFLIWHRMKGKDSFFYPYLQVLGKTEIMIDWAQEDVDKIQDPYIRGEFLDVLREDLPGIYGKFYGISLEYPDLFKQPISYELFRECYSLVVSRCFGWGLPETMMVPYADFLNHDCCGVYHYALNKTLQQSQTHQYSSQYIKKSKDLDLSILQINSQPQPQPHPHPHPNHPQSPRQKFLTTHKHLIKTQSNKIQDMLHDIHRQLLQTSYEVSLFPETDSEDNDSSSDEGSGSGSERDGEMEMEMEEEVSEEIDQKDFFRVMKKCVRKEVEQCYEESQPDANSQFGKGVNFEWWHKMDEKDSYFIVSTNKTIQKGSQIFNSYGRRSNKFLLIWYGFTHSPNKYDSVAFRFWPEHIYKKTGRLIIAKYLTQKDWHEGIRLGNQRYRVEELTEEYRLKGSRVCYQLMAYLRVRVIRRWRQKGKGKGQGKGQGYGKEGRFGKLEAGLPESACKVMDLDLEKAMLDDYSLVLSHLDQIYQPDKPRQPQSTPQRTHFTQLYLQSTKKILQRHKTSIQLLKSAIQKLQSKSTILEAYTSNLTPQQNQHPATTEIGKEIRYWNRRFCLDYWKNLGRNFGNI